MDEPKFVLRIAGEFGEFAGAVQPEGGAKLLKVKQEFNGFGIAHGTRVHRFRLQWFMMDGSVAGRDEGFEEGVGLVGFAEEFGVELAGKVEGVVFEFD